MAKQLIPGNNAVSIDTSGWILFKRPHGTFYSTSTQAIANVSATQKVTYNNSSDVEGLIFTATDSKIYVPTSGSYEIFFSGICDLQTPGPAPAYMEVWLAVDGSPVSDSNTRIQISSTSMEMTVAVGFIYDLNAGQYIEIETWGSDTDCRWVYTAAGAAPTRPATPSVIVTVKSILSKLSYE